MATESKGEWLTRCMERRDLSVRQVADALDVTSKAVHDWRSGKTAVSEERIARLAELLEVTEIEARRGLGYWVPDEDQSAPATVSIEELKELREQVIAVLNRIEEIQRGR